MPGPFQPLYGCNYPRMDANEPKGSTTNEQQTTRKKCYQVICNEACLSLRISLESTGMKISTQKTKTIAFREQGSGPEQNRDKRENRLTLLQLSGSQIDVQEKLKRFLKVTGLINRALNANKTRRETRLRVYNTLAISIGG